MKNFVIAIVAALGVTACATGPQVLESHEVGTTQDGCTIYRTHDFAKNNELYYARCNKG